MKSTRLKYFSRLANRNVQWICDNCERSAAIVSPLTRAVSIVCVCDGKAHPECNKKWYQEGLYHEKKSEKK